MIGDVSRLFTRTILAGGIALVAVSAAAQDNTDVLDGLEVPGLSSFAPPTTQGPLATSGQGEVKLSAHLTEGGPEITRGLVWLPRGIEKLAVAFLPREPAPYRALCFSIVGFQT